jgi:hypothetical protein
MSFCLRWLETPTEIEEAVARLDEEVEAAIAARNGLPAGEHGQPNPTPMDGNGWFVGGSDRWDAAHTRMSQVIEERYRVERNVYGDNIWGMDVTRRVMADYGMLNLDAEPPSGPDFPEADDQEAWWSAYHESIGASTGGRIPLWKLAYNAGAVVRPDEIRASLAAYAAHGGTPDVIPEVKRHDYSKTVATFAAHFGEPTRIEAVKLDRWPAWIAWLGEAADHGGFSVW